MAIVAAGQGGFSLPPRFGSGSALRRARSSWRASWEFSLTRGPRVLVAFPKQLSGSVVKSDLCELRSVAEIERQRDRLGSRKRTGVRLSGQLFRLGGDRHQVEQAGQAPHVHLGVSGRDGADLLERLVRERLAAGQLGLGLEISKLRLGLFERRRRVVVKPLLDLLAKERLPNRIAIEAAGADLRARLGKRRIRLAELLGRRLDLGVRIFDGDFRGRAASDEGCARYGLLEFAGTANLLNSSPFGRFGRD